VYFDTSGKKTAIDPDKFSEEIFPKLYTSCYSVRKLALNFRLTYRVN
jgi:hypothetical protein